MTSLEITLSLMAKRPFLNFISRGTLFTPLPDSNCISKYKLGNSDARRALDQPDPLLGIERVVKSRVQIDKDKDVGVNSALIVVDGLHQQCK